MIANPAGLLAEPRHIGLEWRGKGIIKNDACKNLQASLYIVFGGCLILHIIYQC